MRKSIICLNFSLLLFFVSCKDNIEYVSGIYYSEIENNKIDIELKKYVKESNKTTKGKAFLVYASCDNKKISLVVKQSSSKYEIYYSPLSKYFKVDNNLVFIYCAESILFKKNDILSDNKLILDSLFEYNKINLIEDMDEKGNYIEETSCMITGHEYPIKINYYYEKDSLITIIPYKEFQSKFFEQSSDTSHFRFDFK